MPSFYSSLFFKRFVIFFLITQVSTLTHANTNYDFADKGTDKRFQREFYRDNPDSKLYRKIQVWNMSGGISGIYHMPEGSRLSGALGITGGINSDLSRTKIKLSRYTGTKKRAVYEYSAEQLLSSHELLSITLNEGDIISVYSTEFKKEKSQFLKTVQTMAIIMGLVSASLTTYLLIKDRF